MPEIPDVDVLQVCNTAIGKLGDNAYRLKAMGAVERLVATFMRAGEVERQRIMDAVNPNASFALLLYAREAAVAAVREMRPELLTMALIAVVIENKKMDWRDTLRATAMIFHSASKIPNLDTDQLFKEASLTASESLRSTLESFVNRSPDLVSLNALGLRQTSPPEPYGFVEIEKSSQKGSLLRRLISRWTGAGLG